ncbi:MAG TPA: TIM barrel protein, partial [Dehalococcoidia bacterium]|nr:TIM barrel protein [Dehalococcoidia bacterium]
MSFPLCLNTSTIHPHPLVDKIRWTAAAGFAAIELWIPDLYEHVGRGGEVRDIEKALTDHGLGVPSMIALRWWGDAAESEYPALLDEAKRRMELAARIGARYVVATPPREACDLDQLTRRYVDLLAVGREVGV